MSPIGIGGTDCCPGGWDGCTVWWDDCIDAINPLTRDMLVTLPGGWVNWLCAKCEDLNNAPFVLSPGECYYGGGDWLYREEEWCVDLYGNVMDLNICLDFTCTDDECALSLRVALYWIRGGGNPDVLVANWDFYDTFAEKRATWSLPFIARVIARPAQCTTSPPDGPVELGVIIP